MKRTIYGAVVGSAVGVVVAVAMKSAGITDRIKQYFNRGNGGAVL